VTNDRLEVHWKNVDDTLVATIRFEGKYQELGDYFARLEAVVGPRADGDRIVIYRGGGNMEVCLPVAEPVEDGEVTSRVLEGGQMLCTTFRGTYGSEEAAKRLGEQFGAMWRYTIEHHVGVSEDPWREAHLGDDPEDPGSYTAELQVPMLLPKWLERFHGSLGEFAGDDIRRGVLAGSEGLSPASDTDDKIAWVKGAMARLDAAVPDPDTRREIVCRCAHIYPAEQIEKLKSKYEELGGLDPFMAWLDEDPGYEGAPYYKDPERGDDVIFIDKAPQERDKHGEAMDPRVKRAAACHCPIIKATILRGEEISPTFCNCGAGWFRPLWESLLGRPVKVTCEESVLQGHDRCKFAIYLNEEA
jgi:effector-binding domain-containing protein